MNIDLDQLIHALSDTVDLVGVDEVQHSKRVAYMALVHIVTSEPAACYTIAIGE